MITGLQASSSRHGNRSSRLDMLPMTAVEAVAASPVNSLRRRMYTSETQLRCGGFSASALLRSSHAPLCHAMPAM